MSEIPEDLAYTPEHEYVRQTDVEEEVYVGITDYAQGELGDIVYVELPAPGDSFAGGEEFGTIEAVKTVSELYCPVAGEIVEVNDELDADPSIVNDDPYEEGWMIRLRVDNVEDLEGLLDADGYATELEEAEH